MNPPPMMDGPPPAGPIDEARDRAARVRRLVRWTIVSLLLVVLAFAGLFAARHLMLWLARQNASPATQTGVIDVVPR